MTKSLFATLAAVTVIWLLFVPGCATDDTGSSGEDGHNADDGAHDLGDDDEDGRDVVLTTDDAVDPDLWQSHEAMAVGYDYVLVPGTAVPDNPVKGAKTPDEYNVIPLYRFRPQADIDAGREPRPVDAVVIFQPGFTAGASQLFTMARWLVQASEGRFEVWVPDRRWTLLEDQTGMDAAEAAGNPWIAYDYYFKGRRINGKRYHPIPPVGRKTDMVSEWGLTMWMHDLRRLVQLVPEEGRAKNVILAGDSRGAVFSQAFAAYEFEDGRLGADDLAGLILWDGGIRRRANFDRADYQKELERIRSGQEWRVEPTCLTVNSLIFLEILGMVIQPEMDDWGDPALGPNGFFPDFRALELLYPLLTRFRPIKMTNDAMLGIAIDSDSMPWREFMAHAGKLGGGPVTDGVLGEYPTDPSVVYHWRYWDEVDPPELVDLKKVGKMFYEGPSNFTDAYYPTRISLDADVADLLETEGTWRHDYFRFYSSRVDIPIFAISSAMWSNSTQLDDLRNILPPVRGQDRPRSEVGFVRYLLPEWSHLDALMVEPAVNPIIPRMVSWIEHWTTGQVQVPEF